MASYRLITPNTVELSNGTKPGNSIVSHADVNGLTLSKGAGAVKFKEVTAAGEPVQGARQYAYKYGEVIALGA